MATREQAMSNAGATVGYEAQLWPMADALRGSMDAAEYKHVVLGLIFLKYISDAFLASAMKSIFLRKFPRSSVFAGSLNSSR